MSGAPLLPGLKLGAFTLGQKIALGGMAEIWTANEAVGEGARPVALKILQPFFSNDQTFHAMFWDEVNIAQRLKHQNIVQVFAGHEIGGHLLQSMELVDGSDIRRLLKRLAQIGQWFPAPLALFVGREVARGLSYAHNRKNETGQPLHIVHRDISPHNVMLTRSGSVKILDFGIARAAERLTRTRTGVVKGKLSYMAPEQAMAAEISARTDMFAMAVVLWEMLAMQRLFKAKSDAAILELVIRAEVPPLRRINNVVPEDAEQLIHKMLSQDPKNRPPSMRAVENALTRVLARSYHPDDYTPEALGRWMATHLAPKPASATRRPGNTQVLPQEDRDDPTQLTRPDLSRKAAVRDNAETSTQSAIGADTIVDLPPAATRDTDEDKTVPGGLTIPTRPPPRDD